MFTEKERLNALRRSLVLATVR